MSGGIGATRYYVDNAGDLVTDYGVNDGDQVYTSISYTLTASSLIENLSTTNAAGTSPLQLTGSSLAQRINGNAGANTIDGKGGADTMTGYGGNDRYFVDNSLDKAVEAASGGTDQVLAAVSYTLTANSAIETLSTTNGAGTTAIKLTGNSLAQSILGNNGANLINGMAGNDTLRGLGGSDNFRFSTVPRRRQYRPHPRLQRRRRHHPTGEPRVHRTGRRNAGGGRLFQGQRCPRRR
jgi:Ca2+-binding RTX toxin-like protein